MSQKLRKCCATCGGPGSYRLSVTNKDSREVPSTAVWACGSHVAETKRNLDHSFEGSAYRVLVRLPFRPARRTSAPSHLPAEQPIPIRAAV